MSHIDIDFQVEPSIAIERSSQLDRARKILCLARTRASAAGQPGSWSNGRIIVTADRQSGRWRYDIGTYAKSHAEGAPKEVLGALCELMVDDELEHAHEPVTPTSPAPRRSGAASGAGP